MNTTHTDDQKLLAKRTHHFKKRQYDRRISSQDVLMTLRYGHRHEHRGFAYFYSRGLYIVADLRGNLMTTYWL
jgi:hypothetical protein